MSGGYRRQIDFVRDGEQVIAGVTNRAPQQNAQNIEYLRRLLELAEAGETLIAAGRTVKSDVEVGMPVYFHAGNRRFEKALAQTDVDATTGQLVTAASAQVIGIVLQKNNATSADILLRGMAPIDLSAVLSSVSAGLYYLSGAEPGALTATRPPVGIRVLQVLQQVEGRTWEVFVNPTFADFLDAHRHSKYSLAAVPAGDHTPPLPGQDHDITNPDASIDGWLPATHGSFDGLAPAGAKYGYNIPASSLADVWPPIPVENAVLMMYRNSVDAPSAQLPQLSAVANPELVVIDRNGIWWMSDCYDSVPWPTTLDTDVGASASESACLPLQSGEVLLELWTTSSLFFNNDFGVLSLVAREGSGIQVFCQGTDTEQSVGHLELALDLALAQGDTDRTGHLVVKEFEDQQFHRGPVVESIKSGSPEIVITSDVANGEDDQSFGNVVISADLDINGGELLVNLVRLDSAEEAFVSETISICFKSSRPGAIRCRLDVPSRLTLPEGTQLKLRFWVMGRTAGTIPDDAFELTYRVLSRPTDGADTPVTLPTSDTTLTLNAGAVLANANEYVEIESEPFEVASGDQILFSLSRASPDSYAGDLHVLKQVGVLTTEA